MVSDLHGCLRSQCFYGRVCNFYGCIVDLFIVQYSFLLSTPRAVSNVPAKGRRVSTEEQPVASPKDMC